MLENNFNQEKFAALFAELTTFKANPFHPLVWIVGEPEIGDGVYIGGFSEIQANGARVVIGDNCDIASFTAINCSDSHLQTLGLHHEPVRRDITLENNVFVGSHCVIKGGVTIGHHSVVAAGTVVDACEVPPFSLVHGNPMTIRRGYYLGKI